MENYISIKEYTLKYLFLPTLRQEIYIQYIRRSYGLPLGSQTYDEMVTPLMDEEERGEDRTPNTRSSLDRPHLWQQDRRPSSLHECCRLKASGRATTVATASHVVAGFITI